MPFFFLQAEKKHKSFQELDRFMHYYTRFKNHEHSYEVIHPFIKVYTSNNSKMAWISAMLVEPSYTDDHVF